MARVVTDRDKWETPIELVKAFEKRSGYKVVLDLAASKENAKAERFLTEKDDFLSLSEDDLMKLGFRVSRTCNGAIAWLNPPYSKGNLEAFTAQAARLSKYCFVAVLVPMSPSDGWWVRNIDSVLYKMYLPSKRVQFIPPEGIKASSNSGHNAILVLSELLVEDSLVSVHRLGT